MLYGIDTLLALALPVLWFAAGIEAGRLASPVERPHLRRRARRLLGLCWAAFAAVAGHGLAILTDLSWFITPGLRWLNLLLTVAPAVLVGVLTVPQVLAPGRSDAASGRSAVARARLAVPVQLAALAALVSLFFVFAPFPEPRAVDVAVPLALLVAWAGASVLRYSRRPADLDTSARLGSKLGRTAVSVGMVLAVLVAWPSLGVATAPANTTDPPEATHPVRTESVSSEGDDLYVEVRGGGPPLLMIPGGGGDAGFYTFVADILADDFQVITYDRRGNSRSTRHFPDSFDIAQQARDAVAVIRATGHESAHVFGNSAGAAIALELAAEHPDAVQTVVAHEPPTLPVLPDREKWLGLFASVHHTSFVLGPRVANLQFTMSLKAIPFTASATTPDGFGERMAENTPFLMRHEMQPVINFRPDTAKIARNGVDLIPAAGRLTLDTGDYYGRTAPVLADELGRQVAVFPGHHTSYFDRPVAWSATLTNLLQDE